MSDPIIHIQASVNKTKCGLSLKGSNLSRVPAKVASKYRPFLCPACEAAKKR